MSALTTQNKLLGSNAVFDPRTAYPGVVSFSERVNFAEAPLDGDGKRIAGSVNYDLLEIPAGFVLLNVVLKELGFGRQGEERCAAGTVTLKTKADGATVGVAVTVGQTTHARSFMVPGSAVTAKDPAGTGTVTVPGGSRSFEDGDVLCLASSVDQASGGVEVVISGYFPDPDDTRYSPVRTAAWRKVGNDRRNVAPSDRLLGK